MNIRKNTFILCLTAMLFAFPMEEALAGINATNANIKPGRTRIKQRPNGLYKMTTLMSGGTESSSVKAEIERVGDKSPKPLISSFTLDITTKKENGNYVAEMDFSCIEGKNCLFAKDDDPLGEKYKVTMTVLDKDGKAISGKVTTEVKVTLDEECKVKYSLDEMSISGFDFYASNSEKNASEYPLLVKRTGTKTNTLSIPVSFGKEGDFCVLSGIVRTRKWSKSSSETNVMFNAIYNEKTQTLTANLADMDSVYILGFTTESTICGIKYKTHEVNFKRIQSVQGDEISFKLRKVKEIEGNDEDSSSTAPLSLSEGISVSSSINGSYQILAIDGVEITQKDKPLADLEVEAILELKDCKGAITNISITLKYNESTKEYSSSKALVLCNQTGVTVQSMNVVAKGKDLPIHKWTHVTITHEKG